MNGIAVVFILLNTIAFLLLPRRWAAVPLLVGACYMTLGQVIDVGPFSFSIIRMLVLAGVVRIIVRGERLAGGMNSLDRLMLVWAVWVMFSSFFHNDLSGALIFRLGLVYDACGIYFLLRVFCQSLDDVIALCRITAILLVPVAAEMLYEKLTLYNLFSVLGGVPEITVIREGRIRAQGPFAHAILAGTIGAVCLPLVTALWRQHRKEAIIGIGACLIMIFAAASSGPVMSAIAAIGALWMWRYQHRMRLVRWLAVVGYIALDLVMKAPAYYLIARIDLAGGSTGWHRARLIQSAIEFLPEWWLGGTDYTRHWMPTGVSWSADHTDITNHYIKMGIIGGLPLMILFIAVLAKGFSFVGQTLRQLSELSQSRFMVWALGASLFAHATTFIAVSYFDQSFVFLYLTLAAIGSAWSGVTGYSVNRPQVPDQHALAKIA
jgi:hypothetical protein